jgi:hypothetical protein
MELNDDEKKLITLALNTHINLYQSIRLELGVKQNKTEVEQQQFEFAVSQVRECSDLMFKLLPS